MARDSQQFPITRDAAPKWQKSSALAVLSARMSDPLTDSSYKFMILYLRHFYHAPSRILKSIYTLTPSHHPRYVVELNLTVSYLIS